MAELLPAGRELDALMAEKVFGYHREIVAPDYHKEHGGNEVLVPPGATLRTLEEILPRKGPVALGFFAHAWSIDQTRMWDVVAEMQRRGRWLGLSEYRDGWRATFSSTEGRAPLHPRGEGATPALAICYAALAAVGALDG